MARTNSAVSVGTTATLIAAANGQRQKLSIYNNGSATVYLGDANVTTANGTPLPAGMQLADETGYESEASDAWYGIVASGTCDVRVMES